MLISSFTSTVDLPAEVELGGYGGRRCSSAATTALEVNGVRLSCADTGQDVSLVALDTLYPGDIVRHFDRAEGAYLFAASHTHTAPMLDSAKHGIGSVDPRAMNAHVQAISDARWQTVQVDHVALFTSSVEVPIYRRRDNPDHLISRALTRYCGMYPNDREPIDRTLYLFVLMAKGQPVSALIWHSCHPTSRSDLNVVSPDYVGAIRRAVRARFGQLPCLFLQGCAGDIRPDTRSKRIKWLPDNALNTCFLNPTTLAEQERIDEAYSRAVKAADEVERSPLSCFRLQANEYVLTDGRVGQFSSVLLGESYRFDLLPFEVSHRYWMEVRDLSPGRFLVSCTGSVQGYLPHPTQMRAGGYEVDGSRVLVGAPERFTLANGGWW